MTSQHEIETEILTPSSKRIIGSQFVGIAFGLLLVGTALYQQEKRPDFNPLPQAGMGMLVVFASGVGPTDRFDRVIDLLIAQTTKKGGSE